jgi:transcriptional regulator of aromatic amino acid metabolism
MKKLLYITTHRERRSLVTTVLAGYQCQIIAPTELTTIAEDIAAIIVDGREQTPAIVRTLRCSDCGLPIICITEQMSRDEMIACAALGRAILCTPDNCSALAALIPARSASADIIFTGKSQEVQRLSKSVDDLARRLSPFFICGEPGSGKRSVVRELFRRNVHNDRDLVEINLDTFGSENYETHIWTAIRDIFKRYQSVVPEYTQPLYSMVYINGLERKDILFVISLLEWLYEQTKDTRNIWGNPLRVVVAIESVSLLESIPKEFFQSYAVITIPSFSERQEDIPVIMRRLIAEYNRQYQRSISGVTPDFWEYCQNAPWYGNIEELRYNLEAIFASVPAEKTLLTMHDLYLQN